MKEDVIESSKRLLKNVANRKIGIDEGDFSVSDIGESKYF